MSVSQNCAQTGYHWLIVRFGPVTPDKEHIVEKGNYLKFSKSKDTSLKRKLLDTKDRELVEVRRKKP